VQGEMEGAELRADGELAGGRQVEEGDPWVSGLLAYRWYKWGSRSLVGVTGGPDPAACLVAPGSVIVRGMGLCGEPPISDHRSKERLF
jgi:hypothetical protein